MNKFEQRLDQAARAAWLSYVGGKTQDEISSLLDVSRPVVQRLLALARNEGLIKVHIDHPIASCTRKSELIKNRFDIDFCDVVPAAIHDSQRSTALIDQSDSRTAGYLAVAGGERLTRLLEQTDPQTIALGSGRTVRATVEAIVRIERPQHRFVSLVGNLARDGSSNRYDGVTALADKTGSQRFLLPAPVVAATAQDRKAFAGQTLFKAIAAVAADATSAFVGIGRIDRQATLFQDDFIDETELAELLASPAVGELLGWPMDSHGKLLDCSITDRITSFPLKDFNEHSVIGMAGGIKKGPAVLAALRGGWLKGIIVDEAAADFVIRAEEL